MSHGPGKLMTLKELEEKWEQPQYNQPCAIYILEEEYGGNIPKQALSEGMGRILGSEDPVRIQRIGSYAKGVWCITLPSEGMVKKLVKSGTTMTGKRMNLYSGNMNTARKNIMAGKHPVVTDNPFGARTEEEAKNEKPVPRFFGPDSPGIVDLMTEPTHRMKEAAKLWLVEAKAKRSDHERVIRILTLSPFLYGSVYQPDVWIKYAHEAKLLPSQDHFTLSELTDEYFGKVDLMEEAIDLVMSQLWDEKKLSLTQMVLHRIEEQRKESETVQAIYMAAISSWVLGEMLQVLIDKPSWKDLKRQHVMTAILFAARQYVEHVQKTVIEKDDPLKVFEDNVSTCEKNSSSFKEDGNKEFKQGCYKKAITKYTQGIHLGNFNHVLYGNRAQAYLKTGSFKLALCDGRRAVILKPNWPKGHYRYIEACVKLQMESVALAVSRKALNLCPNDQDLLKQKIKLDGVKKKAPPLQSADVPDLVSSGDDETDSEYSDMDDTCSSGVDEAAKRKKTSSQLPKKQATVINGDQKNSSKNESNHKSGQNIKSEPRENVKENVIVSQNVSPSTQKKTDDKGRMYATEDGKFPNLKYLNNEIPPEIKNPTQYNLPLGKGRAVLNGLPLDFSDTAIHGQMFKLFNKPFLFCEKFPFNPNVKTGCRFIMFESIKSEIPFIVDFLNQGVKAQLKVIETPDWTPRDETKGEAALLDMPKNTPDGFLLPTISEFFENPKLNFQRTPDTEIIVQQRLITYDRKLKPVPKGPITFNAGYFSAEGRIVPIKESKLDLLLTNNGDPEQRAMAQSVLAKMAAAPPADASPDHSPIFIHNSPGEISGKGYIPAGHYQLTPKDKKNAELILTSENVMPAPSQPRFPDFFEELGQAMHMWRKETNDVKVWTGHLEWTNLEESPPPVHSFECTIFSAFQKEELDFSDWPPILRMIDIPKHDLDCIGKHLINTRTVELKFSEKEKRERFEFSQLWGELKTRSVGVIRVGKGRTVCHAFVMYAPEICIFFASIPKDQTAIRNGMKKNLPEKWRKALEKDAHVPRIMDSKDPIDGIERAESSGGTQVDTSTEEKRKEEFFFENLLEALHVQKDKKVEKRVWSGEVEWIDARKEPIATYITECDMLSSYTLDQLDASDWPTRIHLTMVPKKVLVPVVEVLMHTRSTVFRFQDQKKQPYREMLKAANAAHIGVMRFLTPRRPWVALVMLAPKSKRFLGSVPMDQAEVWPAVEKLRIDWRYEIHWEINKIKGLSSWPSSTQYTDYMLRESPATTLPVNEMCEALHNPYSDTLAPLNTVWTGPVEWLCKDEDLITLQMQFLTPISLRNISPAVGNWPERFHLTLIDQASVHLKDHIVKLFRNSQVFLVNCESSDSDEFDKFADEFIPDCRLACLQGESTLKHSCSYLIFVTFSYRLKQILALVPHDMSRANTALIEIIADNKSLTLEEGIVQSASSSRLSHRVPFKKSFASRMEEKVGKLSVIEHSEFETKSKSSVNLTLSMGQKNSSESITITKETKPEEIQEWGKRNQEHWNKSKEKVMNEHDDEETSDEEPPELIESSSEDELHVKKSPQKSKQQPAMSAVNENLEKLNKKKAAEKEEEARKMLEETRRKKQSEEAKKQKEEARKLQEQKAQEQKAQKPKKTEEQLEKEQREADLSCSLRQGSEALLDKNWYASYNKYENALGMINRHGVSYFTCFNEVERVVVEYAMGMSCIEIYDRISIGIKHFQVILGDYKSVVFPLAYYGLGQAFYKQYEFSAALVPLNTGLKMSDKMKDHEYKWPGTDVMIPESRPGKLKEVLKSLIEQCHHPPRPDATCRFDKCTNIVIYFIDQVPKNWVQVKCCAKCFVDYHYDCYKKLKSASADKLSDKDIANGVCLTPDCTANVIKITIYDGNGKKKEICGEQQDKCDKMPPAVKPKHRIEPSARTVKKREDKKAAKKQKRLEAKRLEEEKKQSENQGEQDDNIVAEIEKMENEPETDRASAQQEEYENFNGGTDKRIYETLRRDDSFDDEMYKGVKKTKGGTKKRKDKETKTLPVNVVFKADPNRHLVSEKDFIDPAASPMTSGAYCGTSPAANVMPGGVPVSSMAGTMGMDTFSTNRFALLDESSPFSATSVPYNVQQEVQEFENIVRNPVKSCNTDTTMKNITDNLFSYFEDLLRAAGPLKISDPRMVEELNNFPEEAKTVVESAGGIGNFLTKSLQFAIIQDYVCIMEHAVQARDLVSSAENSKHKLVAKSQTKPVDIVDIHARSLDLIKGVPLSTSTPVSFNNINTSNKTRTMADIVRHDTIATCNSETVSTNSITTKPSVFSDSKVSPSKKRSFPNPFEHDFKPKNSNPVSSSQPVNSDVSVTSNSKEQASEVQKEENNNFKDSGIDQKPRPRLEKKKKGGKKAKISPRNAGFDNKVDGALIMPGMEPNDIKLDFKKKVLEACGKTWDDADDRDDTDSPAPSEASASRTRRSSGDDSNSLAGYESDAGSSGFPPRAGSESVTRSGRSTPSSYSGASVGAGGGSGAAGAAGFGASRSAMSTPGLQQEGAASAATPPRSNTSTPGLPYNRDVPPIRKPFVEKKTEAFPTKSGQATLSDASRLEEKISSIKGVWTLNNKPPAEFMNPTTAGNTAEDAGHSEMGLGNVWHEKGMTKMKDPSQNIEKSSALSDVEDAFGHDELLKSFRGQDETKTVPLAPTANVASRFGPIGSNSPSRPQAAASLGLNMPAYRGSQGSGSVSPASPMVKLPPSFSTPMPIGSGMMEAAAAPPLPPSSVWPAALAPNEPPRVATWSIAPSKASDLWPPSTTSSRDAWADVGKDVRQGLASGMPIFNSSNIWGHSSSAVPLDNDSLTSSIHSSQDLDDLNEKTKQEIKRIDDEFVSEVAESVYKKLNNSLPESDLMQNIVSDIRSDLEASYENSTQVWSSLKKEVQSSGSMSKAASLELVDVACNTETTSDYEALEQDKQQLLKRLDDLTRRHTDMMISHRMEINKLEKQVDSYHQECMLVRSDRENTSKMLENERIAAAQEKAALTEDFRKKLQDAIKHQEKYKKESEEKDKTLQTLKSIHDKEVSSLERQLAEMKGRAENAELELLRFKVDNGLLDNKVNSSSSKRDYTSYAEGWKSPQSFALLSDPSAVSKSIWEPTPAEALKSRDPTNSGHHMPSWMPPPPSTKPSSAGPPGPLLPPPGLGVGTKFPPGMGSSNRSSVASLDTFSSAGPLPHSSSDPLFAPQFRMPPLNVPPPPLPGAMNKGSFDLPTPNAVLTESRPVFSAGAPSPNKATKDGATKQSKTSYNKIVDSLSLLFPNMQRTDIQSYITELRMSRNWSLSGMKIEEIVNQVAERIKKSKAAKQQPPQQKKPLPPSSRPAPWANMAPTTATAPLAAAAAAAPASAMRNVSMEIFTEEEDPCIICHDDLEVDEVTCLNECGHKFHKDCIRKWFREQTTCPTCRKYCLLPDEFPSLRDKDSK